MILRSPRLHRALFGGVDAEQGELIVVTTVSVRHFNALRTNGHRLRETRKNGPKGRKTSEDQERDVHRNTSNQEHDCDSKERSG